MMMATVARVLALCLALLAAGPARSESDPDAALCEAAIADGARRGGVPVEVLHAVALTETGRKSSGRIRPYPWAINREGQGHWFPDRQAAIAFARRSLAEGRDSFDVGCAQINYRWHGHAFPSLEDMFDPQWTATYAAQFLRNLYEERGSWSEAAGAYHSLSPDLAAVYRQRFDRILAGLGPEDVLATPGRGWRAAGAPPETRRAGRAERRAGRARAKMAGAGPAAPALPGSVARMPAEAVAGAMPGAGGRPLLTGGRPLTGAARPLLVSPGAWLY
ncbi:lytic transglycosylase domain-containing protein [Amaricoccus solimangrovi]|uniref:Lytic transglycosylase domain-containing protein n=1 Tax=Amaricoccus solimangrovi TaxID=2589815 RepID=A0A501WW57_9RHOB|nr:lytic transglycosylase domain-containing protein [Amaricoccus solimangrovi]TPE52475.1 lytic transglycosylase domain-containing protein [Amaricoccus solimangrovi]